MLQIENPLTPDDFIIGTDRGYARAKRKLRTRKGKQNIELVEYSWFPTIEGAVRDVFIEAIRSSESRTFLEAKAVADVALARLCEAFAPAWRAAG